jgi:hypothetical protein
VDSQEALEVAKQAVAPLVAALLAEVPREEAQQQEVESQSSTEM